MRWHTRGWLFEQLCGVECPANVRRKLMLALNVNSKPDSKGTISMLGKNPRSLCSPITIRM